MIAAVRAFLRDLRDPHVPLSDVLKATRPKLADLPKPKPIYTDTKPFPTRDEARLAYAEAENLIAWKRLEQEANPKVLNMKARGK